MRWRRGGFDSRSDVLMPRSGLHVTGLTRAGSFQGRAALSLRRGHEAGGSVSPEGEITGSTGGVMSIVTGDL